MQLSMKLLSFCISYHWDKEIFLLPVHSSHGSEQELRKPWNRLNSGSILIWTSTWTGAAWAAAVINIFQCSSTAWKLTPTSCPVKEKKSKTCPWQQSWQVQVMFWGDQHCTKAPWEAHGVACTSWGLDRGTDNFLQTLPLAGSLITDIIGHVLHMQTSKYNVSYELAFFKVNSTWDKYKALSCQQWTLFKV